MTVKLTVRAIRRDCGEAQEFTARGQEAKALLALAEAGPRGVTALECAAWAFRLAAYAHSLRRRFGLAIATEREPHPGGWHGRHVLRSHVEILAVEGGER